MTNARWPEPPEGFALRADGSRALYVVEELESQVRDRRLDAWDAWDRALAAGSAASGRGATAVVPGPAGTRWRLKRMRRGGLLAGFWRDRYLSPVRPFATLAATVLASARGVPTARPIALILESGGGATVSAAMALEELEGSEDLARRVVSHAATRADLTEAIGAVRAMHDRGVDHPDLNLGNLLLRPRAGLAPQAFIIDFDRTAFADGPLPFAARQSAVRRLARSCAKLTGSPGPLGPDSEDLWHEIYAGDDAELARRFARGRAAGRWLLAAHRLGWKRSPR